MYAGQSHNINIAEGFSLFFFFRLLFLYYVCMYVFYYAIETDFIVKYHYILFSFSMGLNLC